LRKGGRKEGKGGEGRERCERRKGIILFLEFLHIIIGNQQI